MTRVVVAWGFGAAFFNIAGGPIYAAFVRSLSTDDRLFGLLAGALPMMSFLQVISARIVQRTGRRKRQMVVNGLIGRALWVVAALLPLLWVFAPQRFSKGAIFWMVLGAIGVSSVFQSLAGTAFFSWMSDLVPERVRPSFFARRMQVGYGTAVVVSLSAGIIADRWNSLPVLCAILALAACAGVADIAMFIGVREPPMQIVAPEPFWSSLRAPLRDEAVRRFLCFISLLMASYALIGSFATLHCLENLHLPKTVTALVTGIVALLGMTWSLGFWKDVIRAYGTRPVMRLCAFGLVFVPLAWLGAQPHDWLALMIVSFASGMMAGGLELCNQNLLTGLSPHIPRPTLIALFSIAGGLSFAAASLFAGVLAQFLRGTHTEIFGWNVLPYHVLFLCSLLVRILNAFVVAPQLREPDAASTLDTVKEIIPELAQSFANLITRPINKKESTP